jgi:Ca2+-binding RTX toxin-like protein
MVDILSHHKIFYDSLRDNPIFAIKRFKVGFSQENKSILLEDNLTKQKMTIQLSEVSSNGAQKVIYDMVRTIHLTTGDIVAAGKLDFSSSLGKIFTSSDHNKISIKSISLFQTSSYIDIQYIVSSFIFANLEPSAYLEINAGGLELIIYVNNHVVTGVSFNDVLYEGSMSVSEIRTLFENTSFSTSASATATPTPTFTETPAESATPSSSPISSPTISPDPSPSSSPSPSPSPSPSSSPVYSSSFVSSPSPSYSPSYNSEEVCDESSSYVLFGSDLASADDVCAITNAMIERLVGEGFTVDFSLSNLEEGNFYIIDDNNVELNNLNSLTPVSFEHNISDPHYFSMSFTEEINPNGVINLNLADNIAISNLTLLQVSAVNFDVNGSAIVDNLNTPNVSILSIGSGNLNITNMYYISSHINSNLNEETILFSDSAEGDKLTFLGGVNLTNAHILTVRDSDIEINSNFTITTSSGKQSLFNLYNSKLFIDHFFSDGMSDLFFLYANSSLTIESFSSSVSGYIRFIHAQENQPYYVNNIDLTNVNISGNPFINVILGAGVVNYYGSINNHNIVNDLGGDLDGVYYIEGGIQDDYLHGGPNNDTLISKDGNDAVYATINGALKTGGDFIDAGPGKDYVYTDSGFQYNGATLSSGSYWDGGEGPDSAFIKISPDNEFNITLINFESVSFYCEAICNFTLGNDFANDTWVNYLSVSRGDMVVLNNLQKVDNQFAIQGNTSVTLSFNEQVGLLPDLLLVLESRSKDLSNFNIDISSVNQMTISSGLDYINNLVIRNSTSLILSGAIVITPYVIRNLTMADSNITIHSDAYFSYITNETYALEITNINDIFTKPVSLTIEGIGSLVIHNPLPDNIIDIDASLATGNHEFTAGSLANNIRGSIGDDVIDAGDGNDVIITNSGVDRIYAGGGDDLVVLADSYSTLFFPTALTSSSYWHGGPSLEESNSAWFRLAEGDSSATLINFNTMQIVCSNNCNFTLANEVDEKLNAGSVTLRNTEYGKVVFNNFQNISRELMLIDLTDFTLNFNSEVESIIHIQLDLTNNFGDLEQLKINIPLVESLSLFPNRNSGTNISSLNMGSLKTLEVNQQLAVEGATQIKSFSTSDNDISIHISYVLWNEPMPEILSPLIITNLENVFTSNRTLFIDATMPLIIENELPYYIKNINGSASTASINIIAGSNDNMISVGTGWDVIDGGEGNDTISYIDSESSVTVNLTDSSYNGGDSAKGDIIIRVENVIGSNHPDILVANNLTNSLTGVGGNDIFVFPNSSLSLFNIVLENGDLDLPYVKQIVDFSVGDKIQFDFNIGEIQYYNLTQNFSEFLDQSTYVLSPSNTAILKVSENDALLLFNPGEDSLEIVYNGKMNTDGSFPILLLGQGVVSDCVTYEYVTNDNQIYIHSIC